MMRKTIIAIIFLFTASFAPASTQAAVSNWQQGASILSRWPDDFSSQTFKQSVDNLAQTGADYVSLVFNYYQSNIYSTDIQKGNDTPTDAALITGINYIHSKGMKVMLKPHLETFDYQWRANINPADRNTWFTNYGNMINHYAQIAKNQGVETFCIGTELISMTANDANPTNTQNWIKLINGVRAIYTGHLTYSANWGSGSFADEKDRITFWSSLDSIGLSAYFRIYSDGTIPGIKQAWSNIDQNEIRPLSQQYGKPVLFTEVGYKSVNGSLQSPFNPSLTGPYDPTEQANAYAGLMEYWDTQPYMIGVHWWNWSSDPNYGGAGNTDYTPQQKPAQTVMTQWFTGTATPTSPPPSSGSGSFTAQAGNYSVPVGQALPMTIKVKSAGGTANGAITDIEIYNSSNQKVQQVFFENQNFLSGEEKSYQTSWTPTTIGNYTIKIGLFNSTWTQNFFWNDSTGQITVSSQTSSPPPPPQQPPPQQNSQIQIWWPTDSSTLSGVQPFKAMISGLDVTQYQMYWQVDGDQLNLMDNNYTDYQHKESLVNLTGWNWKGQGPYTLTFIAKNSSGQEIARNNINIFIVP